MYNRAIRWVCNDEKFEKIGARNGQNKAQMTTRISLVNLKLKRIVLEIKEMECHRQNK